MIQKKWSNQIYILYLLSILPVKKKERKKITGVKSYFSSHIRTKINNNKKMFSYKDQIAVWCARLDSSDGLYDFEVLATPLLESVGNYYLSCGEKLLEDEWSETWFAHKNMNLWTTGSTAVTFSTILTVFFFYSKPPENNHSPDCPGLLSKTCT